MANSEAGKAMIVTVSGDPFASALNGQGGQECVWYQVALNVGGLAQPAEYFPMTWAGIDDSARRLVT